MPVGKSLGGFNADLDKFAAEIGIKVGVVRRKAVLDIFAGVTNRTPVDTGRARASWNISDGQPNSAVAPEGRQEAPAAIGTFGTDPFGTTWVANALPYIEALEFGSSQQAPEGMVRVTLAEVESGIEASFVLR